MLRRCLLSALLPLGLALSACGGGGPAATVAATTGTASTSQPAQPRASLARVERQALRYYAQRGTPIYCGGRKRYAALTFDDGPGPYTALARKWLGRYDVAATFFLVGRNVQPFAVQARHERRSGYALGDHS
jgi:peptidoglycan/xylan/chitin deacetylase (PgdA/CDA1 family)